MSTRDANTKGGTLESGTTHKSGFHDTTPAQLGMGTSGSKDIEGPQRPSGNPPIKAPRGHTIK